MVAFKRIGVFDTWPVEFGRDGNCLDPGQVTAVLEAAAGATDLLVISHGWNNDEDEATNLYDELLGNLSAQTPAAAADDKRRLVVLRVYWPSKRFADDDLVPGGAAGIGDPAASVGAQIDLLLRDFTGDAGRVQSQALQAMKALLPSLDADEDAQENFARLARLLMSAHVNDEEEVLQDSFFNADGSELLRKLSRPFRPRVAATGGAASVGGAPPDMLALDPGGAAMGNLFSGAINGARNLLNLFSYYEMKERAGAVGTIGVTDILRRAQAARPGLRLHLCGHSFGGRLVTAALAFRDAQTDPSAGVRSLVLLQSAFSHNGLGVKYDGKNDGYFRVAFDGNRLAGPIVITHTDRDLAVGLGYPIASRLRNQVASGIGDANDPYGAIGRNGALFAAADVDAAETELHTVGEPYAPFAARRIYNLAGGTFITGHSDIRGPEVAQALRHALDASP